MGWGWGGTGFEMGKTWIMKSGFQGTTQQGIEAS